MKKLLVFVMLLLVPTLALGAVLIISQQPINTDSAEYHYIKGNAFYANKEFESAQANYEKAVSLKPDYEEALNNLAFIYNKNEDYVKAADTLSRLVALKPGMATYHYDYAVNLVLEAKRTGKTDPAALELALSEFKAADRIEPGFMEVKENIAFLEDLLARHNA
jgi:tetratricopeptide (TPR) repeat protein